MHQDSEQKLILLTSKCCSVTSSQSYFMHFLCDLYKTFCINFFFQVEGIVDCVIKFLKFLFILGMLRRAFCGYQ